MTRPVDGPLAPPLVRGISRRSFLKFSAAMAATLALPATYTPRIAAAVAAAPRQPLVWIRAQACGGDAAAFLRSADPTVTAFLLDLLSIEYDEGLMVASGAGAALSLADAMERYPRGYLAVIEGAIPTADDGVACLVGGRPVREVVREVCEGAAMTIAVGSCAFDGGAPAASGSGTGAVGVAQVAPGARLVALPGCPLNAANLAATIVHYLTFKEPPPTDGRQRPYFAYGGLIHNQCERRSAFEFGQFVQAWGDEGAQKGWCLYKVGCKGPQSFANCPTARYAEKTSWPVRAGHGCIACTMPGFWDAMGAAYVRLPPPLPFAPQVTVDQVGMLVVGGIAGVTMVHGSLSIVRSRRSRAARRRAAAAAAGAGGPTTVAPDAPVTEASAAAAQDRAPEPAAVPEPAAGPGIAPLPEGPSSSAATSGDAPR